MRVLVDLVAEGPKVLRDEAHHHLARVLRVRVGDEVTLFDGSGREAEARVTRVWPGEILVQVGGVRVVKRAPMSATLVLGLLKGEKMDWVVQKATELGVARICPVSCAHAVVKLQGERQGTRHARWEKIAAEAARQSGRTDVPEIREISDVTEALAAGQGFRVLFHEGERDQSLRRLIPAEPPADVTVAVGPEGGFAPAEIVAARAAGFAICGLGPRILRAETAAIAAVTLIGYAIGDLG